MPTALQTVEFLKSPICGNIVLPLVAAFVVIFVKTQSKPASVDRFSIQDLAIGFDLMVGIILSLLTFSATLADKIPKVTAAMTQAEVDSLNALIAAVHGKQAGMFITALGFGLLMWITAFTLNQYGWKNDRELNLLGISLPLVFASIGFVLLRNFMIT